MEYYLLSLKWSEGKDYYVWWGPNDSGYTNDIDQAGVYNEEQINSNKLYYSNTRVMPVPKELVEQSIKRTLIDANNENYDLFGIKKQLSLSYAKNI